MAASQIRLSFGGFRTQNPVVHQLQHVLVARNHVYGIGLLHGFARQRADHVVGFVASQFEDRNAVGFERSSDVGQLLRQVSGHFFAIGLVTVILDFLEGLGLQIEPAHAGEAFGLLIAKGGRGHVKYRRQIFRRKVIAQFAQHVDEDIGCRRRQACFGGHPALPRHGVIGAEDEGHGIDQVNASRFARDNLRLLRGSGCVRRSGDGSALDRSRRGFLSGSQQVSLAAGMQGRSPHAR